MPSPRFSSPTRLASPRLPSPRLASQRSIASHRLARIDSLLAPVAPIAPCSGSSSIVGSCRGWSWAWSWALSRTLAHSRTHSRTRTHRTRTLAISTRHTWSGGAVHALAGCSLESSLVAPQVACRSCQTKKRHCYCTVAYECADYLGVQTTRPALAAASASDRLDSKARPARRRAPACRAPLRAAPSASECALRAAPRPPGCGWLRLRRPRTFRKPASPTRSRLSNRRFLFRLHG